MYYAIRLCIFYILLILAKSVYSQDRNLYVKSLSKSWIEFSEEIEATHNIRFFYNPDSIPNIQIIVKKDSLSLQKLLEQSFSSFGVKVSEDRRGNYFLFKDFLLLSNINTLFIKSNIDLRYSEVKYLKDEGDYLKTYKDFIAEDVIVGSKENISNHNVNIQGYVFDESDHTAIPQVRINIAELNKNVTTNIDGFYEIWIKPGRYTLTVHSLGMYEKKYKLTVYSGGKLNIQLKTKSFQLGEAIVLAKRDHNVRSTNMGFEKITSKSIKELPAVLGEQDIVKGALLLPGVQTIGEMSSGFNVRGSPADQNMFYINDLPLYNSSHLFGLYTTFNSDAIDEFEFYKSNIPIEFGGHLSAIFDIEAKEGNTEHLTARGGIGLFSSKALIEGPIKNDSSSSFLISYRTTYSDWVLNKVENYEISNSSASFYDGLINCTYKISENDYMYLFLYGSNDDSNLAFGIKNNYTNLGASLKWKHVFNQKFVSELTLVKSKYDYSTDNYEIEYLGNKSAFELNHNELKLKFRYNLNDKQKFQFGIDSKFYKLDNGELLPLNDKSSIKSVEFEDEQAITASVFLSDQWNITNRFTIEGGIRATYYAYLGPKTNYSYQVNLPIEAENIVDTVNYKKNDIITDHINFDFRISGKYEITPNFSFKAGYSTLHQYIYMLSNSITVSPTNKWKLSDSYLDPMNGQQFSFGLYKNLWKDKIETSAEIYYKEVENQIEFKDGVDLLTNKYPETAVIQGDIKSYGLELMLKKNIGKLNGWINYTYSKAQVKALNSSTGEMNNQGKPYFANYDRPHAFNLTLNYKFYKRFSVSGNIIYSTGRPVTYPTSVYYQNEVQIIGFSERNEYRLPDYFRADLSINIEGNLRKRKLAHSSFSIGLYNLTARENVNSIVFQNEDGKIKAYKISILGTIIPSVYYNLKFGNYED